METRQKIIKEKTQRIPVPEDFPVLTQRMKEKEKEDPTSLVDILMLLSHPDIQEILKMVTKFLKKIVENPQIINNIKQILSNFNI